LSSYILILNLPENSTIKIGALGTFKFPEGQYTYVGSGSLSRIRRHFIREKRLHWHIDYLLQKAIPLEAWIGELEEKTLVKILERKLKPSVKGFGSSDTGNYSHLFSGKPDREFLHHLGYRKAQI